MRVLLSCLFIFRTMLVYRVGGRSCDASVMDLNYGMVSSLDTEFSEDVGGKLLINTLTNYLADEFYRYCYKSA